MENEHEQDELRYCPVCRMPISVLAVRCRHCGETVGRPKKEAETFTAKDLGGESKETYTVSGEVMDALEAFRADVVSSQEAERRAREQRAHRSWLRHQKNAQEEPEDQHSSGSGLPELNAEHRALADFGLEEHASHSPARGAAHGATGSPGGNLMQRLVLGLALLAGVVALCFVGVFGYTQVKAYLDAQHTEEKVVYENRALEMLEAGKPLLAALEEANNALEAVRNPENEQIAEQVRNRLAAEVEADLNAIAWNPKMLQRASLLANQAAQIDSSWVIRDLLVRVEKEVAAYKLVLTEVGEGAESATFKLHDPNYAKEVETVEVGDRVHERFLVKNIMPNLVILEDHAHCTSDGQCRKLYARHMGTVTAAP